MSLRAFLIALLAAPILGAPGALAQDGPYARDGALASELSCGNFTYQEEAQAFHRAQAYHDDLAGLDLDPDRTGVACADLPSVNDAGDVARRVAPTFTAEGAAPGGWQPSYCDATNRFGC